MINDPSGRVLNQYQSGAPGKTELDSDDLDLATIAVVYANNGSYAQLIAGVTSVFNRYGKAGLCASPINPNAGLHGSSSPNGSLNDLTWPADPNAITPSPDVGTPAPTTTTLPSSVTCSDGSSARYQYECPKPGSPTTTTAPITAAPAPSKTPVPCWDGSTPQPNGQGGWTCPVEGEPGQRFTE